MLRIKNSIKCVFVFSLMLLAFACKSKKKEQAFIAPNYIKVSFISIGSGTDGLTRKQFLEYLDSYQAEQKITLEINSWNWGREGEKDYCISTAKLAEEKYNILQDQIKKITENKELIRVSYPETCSKNEQGNQ